MGRGKEGNEQEIKGWNKGSRGWEGERKEMSKR